MQREVVDGFANLGDGARRRGLQLVISVARRCGSLYEREARVAQRERRHALQQVADFGSQLGVVRLAQPLEAKVAIFGGVQVA